MDSAGSTRSSNRPVSRRGGGGVGETVDSPLQYRPVTRGSFNLINFENLISYNLVLSSYATTENRNVVKVYFKQTVHTVGPRPPSSLRSGTASRLTSSLGGPPTATTRIGTAIGNVGNVRIQIIEIVRYRL